MVNNEVFALQSITVAATVLGASAFVVSAFKYTFTGKKEKLIPLWGFRGAALKD